MLTDEDREALSSACGWPGDEHVDLDAAVNAIVARHVKAALNEAADDLLSSVAGLRADRPDELSYINCTRIDAAMLRRRAHEPDTT